MKTNHYIKISLELIPQYSPYNQFHVAFDSCILILIRGVYGAYAKQARITKNLRDGCVAVAVPAAARQVGGTGAKLLAHHDLYHMLVALNFRTGCNLLIHFIGNFACPHFGHVLIVDFVCKY